MNKIHYEIPYVNDSSLLALISKYRKGSSIGDILNETGQLLADKTLHKYSQILDIVTKESIRSCCFTKGYSHYVEGTGSIFCPRSLEEIKEVYLQIAKLDKSDDEYLNALKSLQMRYFSPEEVCKLMAFPSDFSFPDQLTNKQKYRLLGNSLNVHVVAVLIKLLVL